MKLLKKIWEKVGEERFVSRVATVGCTILTLYLVLFTPLPQTGIWAMGVINGFMILVELDSEWEE